MSPRIIAKHTPREHANGAPGLWWVEYRVRPLTDREREALPWHVIEHGVPTHTLETRYAHEQDSEYCSGGPHSGVWSLWDYGQSAQDAADSCRGDSQYMTAGSLDPLHERMKARNEQERQRADQIVYLWARTHHDGWEIDITRDEQDKAQVVWEALLRTKRLSKKAAAGLIPAKTLEALQAPIRADYKRALQARKDQHAAKLRELADLQRESGK